MMAFIIEAMLFDEQDQGVIFLGFTTLGKGQEVQDEVRETLHNEFSPYNSRHPHLHIKLQKSVQVFQDIALVFDLSKFHRGDLCFLIVLKPEVHVFDKRF